MAPAAVKSLANPPKLFVLPTDTSPEARIVTLPNPRTTSACRYLFCPSKGISEFTKIAAPRSTPRSWLLARPHDSALELPNGASGTASAPVTANGNDATSPALSSGYISKDASLYVATPIDPIFLLLPVLKPVPASTRSDPPKQLFLALDDHFDALKSSSSHFSPLLRHASIRRLLEERMRTVCDTVEAGDEPMLRLNEELLLKVLVEKATRMVEKGLPASLEEKYVRRALDIPILGMKREESSISAVSNPMTEESPSTEADTATPASEVSEAQLSLSSTTTTWAVSLASTDTSMSTAIDAPSGPTPAPEGISHLLRVRTALDFLLGSYVPPHISASLSTRLNGATSPLDLTPLTEHVKQLASLRQQALASRSLSDFSRKRAMNEDEEAGETRAEKKRRKEEEEKRKRAGESRGLRDLKKVDTTGMKKMSDFFGVRTRAKQ